MKQITITLCLLLMLRALSVTTLGDEVKIRGPHLSEVRHDPWVVETAVEYDGIYTLRNSDGPRDIVIVSYFEDGDRKGFVSILKIKKDFVFAQPEIDYYGVFEADITKGIFRSAYRQYEIRAVRFQIDEGKALVEGISLDGVLFKKIK